MLALLNSWIYALIGDPRRHSIEHRLFSAVSLINGVANMGGLPVLALQGFYGLLALTGGVGVLFLLFYVLSRFYNIYRSLYWPFILTMLTFVFVNILGNAGSQGGAQYYLIPGLVIAVMLARRARETALSMLLFALATGALFAVETMHPEWITQYPDPQNDRLPDVAGNYLFVQIFTGFLVLVLARNMREERDKSDRLLRNILPEQVAEELKKADRVVPNHYDGATVLFTDFVGFTQIAERLSPQELISELDECFRGFDRIMKTHGLEKIKTIGDAYMAAGGLPSPTPAHAVDATLAALDIQRLMQELRQRKEAAGQPYWRLRLGMHSGPLVAGVIGQEKFAYDVWGDTVNTASRMESSGEPGRINVSGEVYKLIKAFFDCEYRGAVAAKNKGQIEMYFVLRLRPEFCASDGCTPNEAFWRERELLIRRSRPADPVAASA